MIVSNHQLPLLKYLLHAGHISPEKAGELDQRGFGSFMHRDWVRYKPGYGFYLTPEGRKAWDLLQHTEIRRKDPTRPLTRYFDYVAYGFADPRKPAKRKLHMIHKGAA